MAVQAVSQIMLLITIRFTVLAYKIWALLSTLQMGPFLAYVASYPFLSRFAVSKGFTTINAGPLFITAVTVSGWLCSLLGPSSLWLFLLFCRFLRLWGLCLFTTAVFFLCGSLFGSSVI